VGDEVHELCPGDMKTFELAPPVTAGGRTSREKEERDAV
jgi:hypothetical protein